MGTKYSYKKTNDETRVIILNEERMIVSQKDSCDYWTEEYLVDRANNHILTPGFSLNSIRYDAEADIYYVEDVIQVNDQGETVTIFISLDKNGHQIGFISNTLIESYDLTPIFTGNPFSNAKRYNEYKKSIMVLYQKQKEEKRKYRRTQQLKFLNLTK